MYRFGYICKFKFCLLAFVKCIKFCLNSLVSTTHEIIYLFTDLCDWYLSEDKGMSCVRYDQSKVSKKFYFKSRSVYTRANLWQLAQRYTQYSMWLYTGSWICLARRYLPSCLVFVSRYTQMGFKPNQAQAQWKQKVDQIRSQHVWHLEDVSGKTNNACRGSGGEVLLAGMRGDHQTESHWFVPRDGHTVVRGSGEKGSPGPGIPDPSLCAPRDNSAG